MTDKLKMHSPNKIDENLEVMISPYIGSDRAKASAEGYLKKHGYDNCDVTLSKLPVRK